MMRISRRVTRWLLALTLLAPALGASTALGQVARLPQEIITTGAVAPAQQDIIDQYVRGWAKLLLDAGPQMKQGRDQLIEPMRLPLSTPVFKDAYSRSVLTAVRSGIDSPNAVVRTNVLIVAAEMNAPAVGDMAIKSMTDANPGVRYWAAKAVADVAARVGAENVVFSGAQQRSLLSSLVAAMPKETSEVALEQMYRALGSLSIPEAEATLLKILEQRVALHAAGINEGIRADIAGLGRFKTRLIYADAQGRPVDAAVRDLGAIAAKYLQVAARQLQAGKLRPEVAPLAIDTVCVVEDIFNELLIRRFAPEHEGKKPLCAPARAGNQANLNLLMLNVLDWVGTPQKPGILQDSKINIPFNRVTLQPTTPAAKAPATKATAPAAKK